jgi:hypothetical protein
MLMKSKLFLTLFAFCLSARTMASTQGFFGGPDKATILIQGTAGDLDATNLFNAMNVPVGDDGSKISKIIIFKKKNGDSLFNLVCHISKNVANLGSCTLNIYKSEFASIDKVNHEALFMVSGNDAWPIVPQFIRPPDPMSGLVFFSSDKKLGIAIDNVGHGTEDLRIWFLN